MKNMDWPHAVPSGTVVWPMRQSDLRPVHLASSGELETAVGLFIESSGGDWRLEWIAHCTVGVWLEARRCASGPEEKQCPDVLI